MRTVIESPTFQKQADKLWAEEERLDFIEWIAKNPLAGDVIPNADGARKVRWTVKGQGKRGGVRVIYFNLSEQGVIYLLTLYQKSDKENISPNVKEIVNMDIEKIALAIEADAGEALPDLRQSLLEMQNLTVGRITTPEQLLVVSVRKQLQLTQQAFAELIKTPVATLRDWEQGRFKPNGVVICLLNILNKHPEIASELTVI